MKIKSFGAGLLTLALAGALCSCDNTEIRSVTLPKVSTKGITAFVYTGEKTEEAEDTEETAVTLKTTDNRQTGEVPEVTYTCESSAETKPPLEADTTASEAPATKEETKAPTAAETAAVTTAENPEQNGYNVIGENGILVSYIDGHYWGLMPCFGTYGLCDGWIESVNEFAKKLPDVNVYNMIAPTSSEFYTPAGYENFTVSQYNKISYVAEGLKGVTDVDVYSALKAHTDEPIFARTDHHWQPLGAYYAAKAFSQTADFDFPDLSEYKKVTMGGYVGSMYSYSKDRHLYNDPEDFVMYIPPNNDKLKTTYYNTSFSGGYSGDLFTSPSGAAYYCSFLGTDQIIAEIKTNVKNGRTLVMFKESYGNGVVPFLTSGFEKIYVCDMRYFNLNAVDFCKSVGATDLVFSVCTYTPAGTNGKYLKIIMNS